MGDTLPKNAQKVAMAGVLDSISVSASLATALGLGVELPLGFLAAAWRMPRLYGPFDAAPIRLVGARIDSLAFSFLCRTPEVATGLPPKLCALDLNSCLATSISSMLSISGLCIPHGLLISSRGAIPSW